MNSYTACYNEKVDNKSVVKNRDVIIPGQWLEAVMFVQATGDNQLKEGIQRCVLDIK